MKILGLDGSPRKNGNTEKLVRAVLEGAAEKGAEAEFHKLAKEKISPCLGCIGCRETGVCVINDDMQRLYARIQDSDAIVIGSPVYLWQVTAQTKVFMDRLLPFLAPDYSTRLTGKKRLVFAFTQGNPDRHAFEVYFDYLAKLFGFLRFDVKGHIAAGGTRNIDDIVKQADVMEKAREMGRSLVS
ncbi:MAG: flavodoxin family protein [Syntrophales bacterium]